LPPLTLYVVRAIFANKATLIEVASDARETVRAFITSWLIDPLRDVIKTVRAGGEDGVIVKKEAVMADIDVRHSCNPEPNWDTHHFLC
jgi:nuclear-control-of-ATPase protein 2